MVDFDGVLKRDLRDDNQLFTEMTGGTYTAQSLKP